jgi:hypothetical protein
MLNSIFCQESSREAYPIFWISKSPGMRYYIKFFFLPEISSLKCEVKSPHPAMSKLEQAKSILETIRADLRREKDAVITLLKNPKVADWQTIDLKKNQPLLAGSGIDPALISAALADYPVQAKKIGKQISGWDNEACNQLADLIGHPDPDQALSKARSLEAKVQGLAAIKEALHAKTQQFILADQALRQKLNIKSLLEIAKALPGTKRELFDGGLATLALMIGASDTTEETRTLRNMLQEPTKLKARFQRLDATRLPRLVEEVLFHYIEEAVAATNEVNLFLEDLNERMEPDFLMIARIEQSLNALQSTDTSFLVNGIIKQATATSNLISSLYQKRQLKETMATITEALDFLNIFHLLLKNRIIPDLQKEVATKGSTLSPIPLAAKMTKSFFIGAKGIIRSLKMMMSSLTGQPALNEIELQLILEKSIANCRIFYGKSRDDLKNMKYYIDSLVGQFPKPFPYNDLCKLIKTTLTSYGEEVEKFIEGYTIPKDMRQLSTVEIPAKVGKLTATIIKHRNSFQKANADTL